ncbi:hypothetical protein ABPG73_007945 [Tetrahymena malaccensis]
MKFLILSLILTVSITIIVGVAFVLSIFYINLWNSLDIWEQDSNQWILQTQKQILMNSLTSLKILEEYSFNQVRNNCVNINRYQIYCKGLITHGCYKQSDKEVLESAVNKDLIFNQCPENVYLQLNQSQYYVDLYFVRSLFKYNLLTDNQKQFIQMNDFISFYGKAAFYASQQEGLIQLAFIYNSDITSAQYGIPSGFYNYTDSVYESCLGDGFIEPYDPRCRPWFQFSSQHQGYFFFEPYLDSLGQDLLMTLSSQIDQNNQLQSVNSIDIYMINLNKVFMSTQGNHSYSVLLHEFNNTVFSHPLLYNTNLTSWIELEYQNITQNCKTQQQLELCLAYKDQFQYQVNSSIDFIKKGDYSIEQQYNLDSLYQYWTLFGDQRISMIYPIRSQIKGFNNQQPYSFAIVLAAKVIQDKREQLKLFNLLNANFIRVPLIISFLLISLIIILFIINYGRFQVLQIWYPIELLILFLKQSILMDQSCRMHKNEINNERQKIQQSINKHSPQVRYDNSNNISIFKQIDSQHKMLDQTNSFVFGNFNNSKINNSIIFFKDKRNEEFKSNHQINKIKQSQISQLPEEIFNLDVASSYKTIHSVKSFQFQFNRNKSILQSNQLSQIQDFHNSQREKDDKNKILKGLKPAFQEMKIIKQAFQELELVINYSVQSSQIKQQDNLRTLFHFTKAKQLFLKLKNDTGLSRCYYNLGLIYLLKEEYNISSEYFESAIQLNLDWLDLSSFSHVNQYYARHQDEDEKNQLIILTKRIFSQAYSQKCAAFQQISVESKSIKQDSIDNFVDSLHSFQRFTKNKSRTGLKQQYSQQLLIQSLNLFQKVEQIIQNFTQDFSEIFQIFLFQEIVEILIQLNLKCQIPQYITKINFLFQNNSLTYQILNGIKKNISFKENISIKQMVTETFKGKQLFLLGMIEKANKNLYEAIEYLTQSLEIPTHYNYFQKIRTFQALAQTFEQLSLKKSFIDEEYLSSETQASVDLIILIQFDKNLSQLQFINIIENLKKFNFFGKNDRIQILLFSKEIHQFIPYTQIQSDHHWKLLVDSLQNLGKDFIKNEKKLKKQLTLEQIIFETLIYIYESNNLELQQIFKPDFNPLSNKNQSSFFEAYSLQNNYNQNTLFAICSQKEYFQNKCPEAAKFQYYNDQYYMDFYYVRAVFKYNDLSIEQKQFIKMVDFVSFYARAALLHNESGLIQIYGFSSADTSSIFFYLPTGPYPYYEYANYEMCQGQSYTEPYDPRCRFWYIYASQNQGYFFYEPYIDATYQEITSTVSSQQDYQSQFYSVNSIDYGLQNLNEQFNYTKSQNAYSILLHEFNSTVFYHPQMIYSNLTSWPDLEFYNITSNCQTQSQMQVCSQEKQILQDQLNQTIEFIKSGNYQIQEMQNINSLYQYWSRYGKKQVSILFPVNTYVKGVNTQLPYSYSILLTGRVILDQRDSIKLFNILNVNIIKIPLITEFGVVGLIIIIFLTNYGVFVKFQIQDQIEILILFLKTSLKQQELHYEKQQIKINQRQTSSQQLQNKNVQMTKKKKSLWCNTAASKKQEKQLQQQYQEQQNQVAYCNSQQIGNLVNKSQEESNFQDQSKMTFQSSNSKIQLRKNQEQQTFNLEQIQDNSGYLSFNKKQSHHVIHRIRIENKTQSQIKEKNPNLSMQNYSYPIIIASSNKLISKLIDSPIQYTQRIQKDQQKEINNTKKQNKFRQDKILSGLKPLFLEMQIIKDTFQMLERVINYSISQNQQNKQNQMQTVYHFTQAKTTFKKLKNDIGQSRCYFNLGVIYLLKNETSLASEYFESALQLNLQLLGINSLNQLEEHEMFTPEIDQENQIIILCKRIFSKAYCLKYQACEKIHNQIQENNNIRKQQINVCIDYKTNNFTLLSCQQKVDLTSLLQESLQSLKTSILDNFKVNDSKQLKYNKKQFLKQQKNLNSNFPEEDEDCKLDEIMIEILNSREYFLQGLVAKQKKQYHQAIFYFTKSLEESSHYSPLLRKKIFLNLEEVLGLEQKYHILCQEYFDLEIDSYMDITILIQLENYKYNYTIQNQISQCRLDVIKQLIMFTIILRLIIIVSIPIIIGVGLVLIVFYQQLWFTLDECSNYIWWLSRACSLNINLLQLYVKLYIQIQNQVIRFLSKENPSANFTVCSYRELIFNQCPNNVYDQLNQNMFYADMYFVRSTFKFNLLTPQQQYFIEMNNRISFYARASFLATQTQGLIQLIYLYNSDSTSISYGIPSGFYNYTDSDYESCMGHEYIEPYDPRCRPWYAYAQQHQGFFIYEPYIDAIIGSLLMTLSSQVDFKNQFYSVNSIDFGMQNLVQLFNTTLSKNAYSVLIHEFNQTLFYHPMLTFYQVSSWADIEYFNINQLCSDSIQQMQYCQNQKDIFSSQVDETINFIKSGNYSIEDQFNLDQLYQKWERFGQKMISIIFPIKSQLKGSNNQQPYSYTIIMTARVITENSDHFKLFNLLNVNSLRIPNPIQLLILFLRRSYMDQQSCQLNEKIKNKVKQKQIKDENSQNYQQQNDQSDNRLQTQINQLQTSQNQSIIEEQQYFVDKNSKYSFNQTNESQKFQNKNQQWLSAKNSQAKSQLNNSYIQFHSSVIQKNQRKFNEKLYQKSSDESIFSFQQFNETNDEFYKIQQLDLHQEKVYEVTAQNQNSKDFMDSLFHFVKAKTTFQQLKNQIGLSRCYYNLGIIYLLKQEYYLAQEHFQSAVLLSLEALGLDQQNLTNQKIIFKQGEMTENQFTILCKRICSKAYACKQYALQHIYLQQKDNDSLESYKSVEKAIKNNNLLFSDLFKVFLCQEILEILIFLEIQKGKQFFLQGLVEIKKQNYTKAIEYFTQVIEEGNYYSPQLRRKTIYHLDLLFKIKFNKQIDLKKLYLDQEACISYDITIILQLECQNLYPKFENCIKNLKNLNFFRKFDRIQILIYHSQLDVFLPFTLIRSDHQLNQIIISLRGLGKKVIQVNQRNQYELNWIHAIEFSLNCICECKYTDISNLKQILNSAKQGQKSFMNYTKHLKIQQNINEQQRKKIVLLFSRQQNSSIQSLNISKMYKLLNNQKLIIYHLKDQASLEKDFQNQQTPFLNYESFTEENLFINKFYKIREEDTFNEEYDFLAILNNS